MRWSKGQGYLRIVERHEFGNDPEQKRMLKLTMLASGLGDLWIHLMRHNPTVLASPLPTRPEDPRNIEQLLADRIDALGESCLDYLDRKTDVETFKTQVREQKRKTIQLASEIEKVDRGRDDRTN